MDVDNMSLGSLEEELHLQVGSFEEMKRFGSKGSMGKNTVEGETQPKQMAKKPDLHITTSSGSDSVDPPVAPVASSRTTPARCEKLYMDHARTKLKVEQIKNELQREQCPFSPKITKKAMRFTSEKKEQRFDQLYRAAKAQQDKLQRKKEELQKDPNNTFSPKITAKAKANGGAAQGSRFDRLFRQHQAKQNKLEMKRQEQLTEFSFSPKTNKRKGKGSILYPSKERLQRQTELIERKKLEIELQNCTFKPKILSKFGSLRNMMPLYLRQEAVLMRRFQQREILKAKWDKELLRECTFTPNQKDKIELTQTQIDQLSFRLYMDAARMKAKKALLKQSVHLAETTGRLKKIKKHLENWDMKRLKHLYQLGKDTISKRLSHAKDPNFKHSRDIEKELEDIKNCTFSPKLAPLSVKLDALQLERSGIASPRYIRLYNHHQVVQGHIQAKRDEINKEIDDNTNISFCSLSPTGRKQRKANWDPNETFRLYLDAERIEQRKERLYYQIRQAEHELCNIRFSAKSIDSVDHELKHSGRISPVNRIRPRSPELQEDSLTRMYMRGETTQHALTAVRHMYEADKEQRARTKFSSKNIKKFDQLKLQPIYDFNKSKKLLQHAKSLPPSPRSAKSDTEVFPDLGVQVVQSDLPDIRNVDEVKHQILDQESDLGILGSESIVEVVDEPNNFDAPFADMAKPLLVADEIMDKEDVQKPNTFPAKVLETPKEAVKEEEKDSNSSGIEASNVQIAESSGQAEASPSSVEDSSNLMEESSSAIEESSALVEESSEYESSGLDESSGFEESSGLDDSSGFEESSGLAESSNDSATTSEGETSSSEEETSDEESASSSSEEEEEKVNSPSAGMQSAMKNALGKNSSAMDLTFTDLYGPSKDSETTLSEEEGVQDNEEGVQEENSLPPLLVSAPLKENIIKEAPKQQLIVEESKDDEDEEVDDDSSLPPLEIKKPESSKKNSKFGHDDQALSDHGSLSSLNLDDLEDFDVDDDSLLEMLG